MVEASSVDETAGVAGETAAVSEDRAVAGEMVAAFAVGRTAAVFYWPYSAEGAR